MFSIQKHNGEVLGPHAPHTIPEFIPSHTHWLMTYIDHMRGTSAFGMSTYTQEGNFIHSRLPPVKIGLMAVESYINIMGGITFVTKDARNFLLTSLTIFVCAFVMITYYCVPKTQTQKSCPEAATETVVMAAEELVKVTETVTQTLVPPLPKED